jgi:putative ABC transport system substrate-binding protein
MYPSRDYAEEGGLVSYGVSRRQIYWRAAEYIDRILKGAKPGDLPIEQPMKFELGINLRTAKAVGLTPSVLVRAVQVTDPSVMDRRRFLARLELPFYQRRACGSP